MKETQIGLIAMSLVLCSGWPAQAQNVSITDDSSAANPNAMLDVKSPAIGDGRGIGFSDQFTGLEGQGRIIGELWFNPINFAIWIDVLAGYRSAAQQTAATTWRQH